MTNRRFNLGLLALLICFPALLAAWPAQAAPHGDLLRTVSVVDLSVTGAASICTFSITPTYPVAAVRVFVGVKAGATNSVFNVVLTTANGGSLTLAANSGTALTAGSAYTFTFLVPNGCTYNFTLTTSTTLGALVAEEVPGDEL